MVAALAAAALTASGGSSAGASSPAPAPSRTSPAARPRADTGATATAPAFVRLATPATPARASVRVPVLMYHRVAPASTITNATSADLTVTPARFADQMAWLRRNGYHAISQRTLFEGLYAGTTLPRRPIVLTFDDGYVDDVKAVQPVLRRYGWPATAAVIAGRAGKAAFLSWRQMAQLERAGWDIASHSMDHVQLAGAPSFVLRRQLVDSRKLMSARLGHPIYWFVYPAGSHDATAERAAQAAGYLLAYTTVPGSTISSASPMAEPRVRIHGADSLATFASEVSAATGR